MKKVFIIAFLLLFALAAVYAQRRFRGGGGYGGGWGGGRPRG